MNIFRLPLSADKLATMRALPNEVLLVVPTGSYAYGTATDESDLDLIGVYLPTMRQLALQEVADLPKIRYSADGTLKGEGSLKADSPGDVTIQFMSLSELVSGYIRGVPLCLEILSYLRCNRKAGKEDERFSRQVMVLDFLDRLGQSLKAVDVFPLLSFSKKNVDFIIDRSNRLATYQALKAWVKAKYEGGAKRLDRVTWKYWSELIGMKGVDPLGEEGLKLYGKPLRSKWTFDDLDRFLDSHLGEYGDRTLKAQILGYDIKSLGHALRCLMEVKEILLAGYITYPLAQSELLVNIKAGKVPIEEVHKILFERFAEVNELVNSIPNFGGLLSSARDEGYEFVSTTMLGFYQRLKLE